jgi:hypothetical protein
MAKSGVNDQTREGGATYGRDREDARISLGSSGWLLHGREASCQHR